MTWFAALLYGLTAASFAVATPVCVRFLWRASKEM